MLQTYLQTYRRHLQQQSLSRQFILNSRSCCFFSTWNKQEGQLIKQFYSEELKAVHKFDLYNEKPVPFVNRVFKNPHSVDASRLSHLHPAKTAKTRKLTPQSSALFKEYTPQDRHQVNFYF